MAVVLELIKTFFYGIIEGITEWLPVSSTGHLILFETLFWKDADPYFFEMFRVVIQLGAIMAVVVSFFRKLNPFAPSKSRIAKKKTWSMWFKIVASGIPAAIVGLPFDEKIDSIFYNFPTVAIMLIAYGIIFIIVESVSRPEPTTLKISELTYKQAVIIGICQVLALVPGTSRSGVTIICAMLLGCSRTVAAEYSFFLAIPIMVGASGVKALKFVYEIVVGEAAMITGTQIVILAVGMIVSFIVSAITVHYFMKYIKKRDFKPFGWYRIIVGIILLAYYFIFM